MKTANINFYDHSTNTNKTVKVTERLAAMRAAKTGNDKAAYTYRLLTDNGNGYVPFCRYSSIGSAIQSVERRIARGESPVIDLA